jgi:uncharacterized protein YndB with AHSA1/START domain
MLRRVQEIEVEREFCAPQQEVWDVYTDHAGWSAWAGFQKSWLEVAGSPDRNGTGAVRGFSSAGVRVFEEVVEFEPPKRMTYRVVRGGGPMKDHLGEVVFEPDGAGTRVIWCCRFNSKVPGLGPLMRFFVTWILRRALEGLERHSFPG